MMAASTAAATIAPSTCPTMYPTRSLTFIRPAVNTPRLTAGLMWQPEIGPMPYAIAISAKPKAKAMPSTPMPLGWPILPAITAAPQPKNTRVKVPMNSAKYFRMSIPPRCACTSRRTRHQKATWSWTRQIRASSFTLARLYCELEIGTSETLVTSV